MWREKATKLKGVNVQVPNPNAQYRICHWDLGIGILFVIILLFQFFSRDRDNHQKAKKSKEIHLLSFFETEGFEL
ncbi:MAG: hypothetical protein AB1297_04610 [bacterium]